MAPAYLVFESESTGRVRVPVGGSILIGRTSDCGFVVDDTAASRHHMRIDARNGAYVWKDLDSTNGVLLNDRPMREGEIVDGDEIRIGRTAIRFEVEPGGEIDEWGPGGFRHTILRPSGEVVPDTEVGQADRLLAAVYALMNDIATEYDPCRLVDRILETTMKAIDAERGAVYFCGPNRDELLPCPACDHVHAIVNGKLTHSDSDEIHISETVAHRVLVDGESVLIQDTSDAEGYNPSKSIVELDLRSIMCAPLKGKFGVMGILYVDSNRQDHRYTHDHLLLSTAVGKSAGLALENVKLHEEILLKQRTDQELEHAASIQESFLVSTWPSDEPHFDAYGEMRPAKIIGGDFYDFIRLSPDRVGVLIGDVSGKGIPAALAMAQILAEFRVHAMREASPATVLRELNEHLVETSQRGMFCTICYATLDLSTGHAICANAGHHSVVHARAKGTRAFADASGPPIGVVRGAEWEESKLVVEPGDLLLMYTDGILEARAGVTRSVGRGRPEEFGEDRIAKAVVSSAERSTRDIVRALLADVDRHCMPDSPHDDCTLVALRYLG